MTHLGRTLSNNNISLCKGSWVRSLHGSTFGVVSGDIQDFERDKQEIKSIKI